MLNSFNEMNKLSAAEARLAEPGVPTSCTGANISGYLCLSPESERDERCSM